MDGKCNECGQNKMMHHYIEGICYDCYEDWFKSPAPTEEEPDFVLKHEQAVIGSTEELHTAKYLVTSRNVFSITYPKMYKFDEDCRVKDYDKLIKFILDNMVITEKSIGFDKVKYMFKEVE